MIRVNTFTDDESINEEENSDLTEEQKNYTREGDSFNCGQSNSRP